jgi:type IV secretion system protein VirD4
MGEAILPQESEHVSQHWILRARLLSTATLMYAKLTETSSAQATMDDVLEMLSWPPYSKDEKEKTLSKLVRLMHAHPHRGVARLAGQFIRDSGKEFEDVLSTLHGHIAPLNDMVADMAKHPMVGGKPFHFGMLKEQLITVYIIVPTGKLVTYSVWLRLIISNAINALMGDKPGKIQPLLMLNEAGNLGYLQPLEAAINTAAGKGLKIWSLWQSSGQILELYGKEGLDAFLGSAGAWNAFAPGNDMDTADLLSRRCGMRTAVIRSYSQSKEDAQHKSDQPIGFPLLRAEEISAMPEGALLSFIEPFSGPLKLQAPGYFETKHSGLDPNPYYRKQGEILWLKWLREHC